ncbi:unnamed protein product [Pseudo-nitzschia multistriata]|uniref:PDZ domain-containing protein n=1 Tax=Pseudo-nitzschia multistriata TaxID=183589 RepID=A0A448ZAN1_9STRA|nr:unnamed protein product [Pseudo-nitzschia multistriata]
MKTNIDLISLACQLCRMPENDMLGELLAFQQQGGMQQKRQVRMCCVHLNCVKHTNIVDTSESQNARMNHEYRNVFEVLDHSKICSSCSNTGASIRCSADNCDQIFHYHCAIGDAGWDFERKGRKKFYCKAHRNITNTKHANGAETSLPRTLAATMHGETGGEEEAATKGNSGNAGGGLAFHHNLFSTFGGTSKSLTHLKTSVPGNLDMSGAVHSPQSQSSPPKIGNSTHKTAATTVDISDDESSYADDDDDSFVLEPEDNGEGLEVVDLPLSQNVSGSTQPIRLERSSREEFWNVSLKVLKTNDGFVVMVASSGNDLPRNDDAFSLQANDIIVSLNGSKVGSRGLETLREILLRLKQEVDLMLEIVRNKG